MFKPSTQSCGYPAITAVLGAFTIATLALSLAACGTGSLRTPNASVAPGVDKQGPAVSAADPTSGGVASNSMPTSNYETATDVGSVSVRVGRPTEFEPEEAQKYKHSFRFKVTVTARAPFDTVSLSLGLADPATGTRPTDSGVIYFDAAQNINTKNRPYPWYAYPGNPTMKSTWLAKGQSYTFYYGETADTTNFLLRVSTNATNDHYFGG